MAKAETWDWSSAKAHLKGEKDQFLSRPDWLTQEQRGDYISFFNREGNDSPIRKATSTGRPLGGSNFTQKIGRMLGRDLTPKKGGRPKKGVL